MIRDTQVTELRVQSTSYCPCPLAKSAIYSYSHQLLTLACLPFQKLMDLVNREIGLGRC